MGVGVGVVEGVTDADVPTEDTEEDACADADTLKAGDTCVDESFDDPHAVNTRAAAAPTATTLQCLIAITLTVNT